MKNEFSDFDKQTLTEMYEREFEAYKMLLISGKSWGEVLEKRKMVTQLTFAIHGKTHPPSFNPDAYNTRETNPPEENIY